MSISLQKGQKISLTKDENGNDRGLDKVIVGLGWDAAKKGLFGKTIDCDASVLMLENGKLTNFKKDVVYYGNTKHSSKSVKHSGDNLTGDGDGDDEQIIIKLNQVPDEYDKLVIVVNIYQAHSKKQDFGLIKNAYMHIFDADTNEELVRYNLTDDYAGKTAVVVGEIYRKNGEWKVNAIGQGTTDDSIRDLAERYIQPR